MTETQKPNRVDRVAGTPSVERHRFDDRSSNRAVAPREPLPGSATPQPASTQAQLDALDAALNAVHLAWREVVYNPDAFSAIIGHYCDEADDRGECIERLRAALDLEPVRFAIRLARRPPCKPADDPPDPAQGIRDCMKIIY